jgi:hypothetical protein
MVLAWYVQNRGSLETACGDICQKTKQLHQHISLDWQVSVDHHQSSSSSHIK